MEMTMENLTALGIDEAAAADILAAHHDALVALEAERDSLLEQAGAQAEMQRQRDELLGRVAVLEATCSEAESVQQAYDAYRAQVEQERSDADKVAALRRALRLAGVQREEFIDLLMDHIDLAQVALDNHQVRDAELLIAPLKVLYSGCFATQHVQGAPFGHPLHGSGGMTKADIMAIRDATKRQQAIAAHHELFGY